MDTDFERLYNTYFMQVYSFAMTLTKNREMAEEIAQRTFFKILTSGKKHRGDAAEFTWLCAIAKNLFIDEIRKQKQTVALHSQDFCGENPEQNFTDEDTAFQIHLAVHELEEPYKEVFQLRVFGELSFQKIGMLFHKTENWARVTHHRARLKIQERMEQK